MHVFVEDIDGELFETVSTSQQPRAVPLTETPANVSVHHGTSVGPRASGYHLATRDHPFLDMSTGLAARVEDARIMASYVEVDNYPSVYLDFPSTSRDVVIFRSFDLHLDELRNVGHARLSLILYSAFGAAGYQVPYHDEESGYHQLELVRKSVPSGGSRHPTEAFIHVHRAPEGSIPPGWYHFSVRRSCLVGLDGEQLPTSVAVPPDVAETAATSDADFVISVHLHWAVDRAMFRYRDPRSFRALLVDAGHADAQLAAFAAYCNWRYASRVDVATGGPPDDGSAGHLLPRGVSGLLEGWGTW